MRRISNFTPKKEQVEPDFSLVSTTLEELSNKAQEILRREILNLMGESTGGKLSPTSSASLVSYIKLLGELRDKELEDLSKLGDDHLKRLSEEA